MPATSVFLVDDHRIVRQGIRSILDPDPQFEVVGEAPDGSSALEQIKQLQPRVVLLDLRLPDLDGIAVCQKIAEISPDSIVLILSAFINQDLVNTCLKAGARGYLVKDAENLHLKEQLISALQGYTALDPRAASHLTDMIRKPKAGTSDLSLRDLDILRLVAQGLTNREIGVQLQISENTVKGYVKEILSKLNVHSRIEAVLVAKRAGLL